MSIKRNLFGIKIDAVRMNEAVANLRNWISQDSDVCRYVVTPNVDHTVLLQENKDLVKSLSLIHISEPTRPY